MFEEQSPQKIFQPILLIWGIIDTPAIWPALFQLADKVFLIWYVIMIKNTKSSINTTSTPTKLILHAELTRWISDAKNLVRYTSFRRNARYQLNGFEEKTDKFCGLGHAAHTTMPL